MARERRKMRLTTLVEGRRAPQDMDRPLLPNLISRVIFFLPPVIRSLLQRRKDATPTSPSRFRPDGGVLILPHLFLLILLVVILLHSHLQLNMPRHINTSPPRRRSRRTRRTTSLATLSLALKDGGMRSADRCVGVVDVLVRSRIGMRGEVGCLR